MNRTSATDEREPASGGGDKDRMCQIASPDLAVYVKYREVVVVGKLSLLALDRTSKQRT